MLNRQFGDAKPDGDGGFVLTVEAADCTYNFSTSKRPLCFEGLLTLFPGRDPESIRWKGATCDCYCLCLGWFIVWSYLLDVFELYVRD